MAFIIIFNLQFSHRNYKIHALDKSECLEMFFFSSGIIQQAAQLTVCESICSFCSRMKRGRLYACARRGGYNVLAMGQHLDDLAERFVASLGWGEGMT